MPPTAIYIGAFLLALVSIGLFVFAVRRMLRREAEVVATMLERYDERLASFAQTLNDALASQRPALESIADGPGPLDTNQVLLRTLELAAARTNADAAIAVLAAESNGPPTIATIRLSHEETASVARIGFPDYRDARALQVSFNPETAAASESGTGPIRSGLFISLLGENGPPSMVAVLTRSDDRRFTDDDILGLEEVVTDARPVLQRTLALTEPDPVPAIDSLTELYDRQAFVAILDREIARARLGRYPLALLVTDVDRLTTLNVRVGRLAADDVLAEVAVLLRESTGRDGLPSRVGGGRFAVLLPHGDASSAERLFARFQDALATRHVGDEGDVSASAGVAELTANDDAGVFVARANRALALAKQAGRGMLVGRTAET